jgi:hypothetical protein
MCTYVGNIVLMMTLGITSEMKARSAAAVDLPAESNLVPEFSRLGLRPRAQGNRDVCSLFAITALAEFESGRREPESSGPLSEEYLIWAANNAKPKSHTSDQAMFYEAVAGLETLGICQAGLMPYSTGRNARHEPSPEALKNARELAGHWRVHWVRRWNVARTLDDSELNGIKEALALGHPVACGLRWPKTLRGSVLREVPPPQAVYDGHSIALVGYADSPTEKGGGMFVFRNSFGGGWGEKGYGRMSYAYVRAYANDALWLEYVRGRSGVPLERFEAESMAVISERCNTNPQDMLEWGGAMWGGGRQLFCRAQNGGSVTLEFSNPKGRRCRLVVFATAAPDFGILRVRLDGKPVGAEINLYSGRVCPSGSIDLGAIYLSAGQHALQFKSVGKDPASANVFFGIDAVELAVD